MLNFCPLCVAEVYALRCDAVFLYLQNLYLSTSKRCIKMGIPSLNSAIFYNVSLYFNLSSRASLTLSFLSLSFKRQADYERAQRVEKSKSCKYNKYPGPRPRKGAYLWPTSLFLTPRPRKRPFFWPPGSQSKLCLSRESSELSQGC